MKAYTYTSKTLGIDFCKDLVAVVNRGQNKYGAGVEVVLKNESGDVVYKFYSFLRGRDAALSAICSFYNENRR